jgi:mannan endo-1,4-beta-mannosidase
MLEGPMTDITRRGLLAGGAAATAATVATGLVAEPAAARPRSDFVTVSGGGFRLGGRPFRFGGTNTYYLHQKSHYMIDNALGDAAAMGLRVVRAEAFADGTARAEKPLQPAPYRYDEAAFDSLDYAVYRAGQLGLRLVLVLVNNWPDYGGMAQYVSWFLGLPDDSYTTMVNHDRFYDTPAIQDCYRAYVRHVMGRVNRYTGLRYTDDPTVMTWQLANEPRSRSDKTGERLLGWVRDTSGYVRRLAPHQLVAVGDEGFYGDPAATDYPYSTYEGDRWKDFVALDTVDYGTVHLYPQSWGHAADPVAWGTTWITDHLADGRAAGKPVVLEEYGLGINAAQGIPDAAARDAGYRAWTDAVLANGGAGDQFWLLTSRVDDGSFYPDYDGLRVYWFNDATNPTNSTAHLLAAHAAAMAAG